jgi:pimeloyl-ACP methyl ester carboxylesterase
MHPRDFGPWILLASATACGRPETALPSLDPTVPDAPAPTDPSPGSAADADVVAPAASAQPARPIPAQVSLIDVPGDSPAAWVQSRDETSPRIVFLPGVCSNAYAYLLSFPEAARAHGGIVAIDGDRPCGAPNSGYHSFSWDPAKQDARIRAALVALGGSDPPRGGLTLVGYSAGAGIGQLMAQRWPERYTRVVLIGAPSDPSPQLLAKEQGVVTMSCSRDVPGRMRDGARHIGAVGVPATYLEMPGCTHGNIADGERVFDQAFDWLDAHARS